MKDVDGVAWSLAALETAMSDLDEPTRGHWQLRVGNALLWTCVIDDVCWRVEGGDYLKRRAADNQGRVIPGLQFAFNALKHGSALVTSIKDVVGIPGMSIGQRVWVSLDRVRAAVDVPPSAAQVDSYRDTVEGQPFADPLLAASSWLKRSYETWTTGGQIQ